MTSRLERTWSASSKQCAEILEKGSDQIDHGMRIRPQEEIRLRRFFAYAYHRLGEHKRALENLRRALQLAEDEYGMVDETVADILTELADEIEVQREKNSLMEDLSIKPFDQSHVQALAQRALNTYNSLGIDSLGKGHALFCVAWYVEPDVARHTEAEGYLREALRIAQNLTPGEDSHRQVYAMWDLVELLPWQEQRGTNEAESLILQAVRMSERCIGPKDPVTAGVIGESGEVYRFKGDTENAVRSILPRLEHIHRNQSS